MAKPVGWTDPSIRIMRCNIHGRAYDMCIVCPGQGLVESYVCTVHQGWPRSYNYRLINYFLQTFPFFDGFSHLSFPLKIKCNLHQRTFAINPFAAHFPMTHSADNDTEDKMQILFFYKGFNLQNVSTAFRRCRLVFIYKWSCILKTNGYMYAYYYTGEAVSSCK